MIQMPLLIFKNEYDEWQWRILTGGTKKEPYVINILCLRLRLW
jgi:hypothetical protein